MSAASPLRFSIVICTYNRLDHLPAAIDSALQQTLDPAAYEVIVVDNSSTDGTADAVQSLLATHPNLRYKSEMRLGLATARNTGWQAASGDYVAFLDDDAKAERDWLATARDLLDAAASTDAALVHCVGGPILPFYTSPKPSWWLDKYEIRTRGDGQRLLRQGEFFSGSNMIWRRASLAAYGGFEINAGMKGTQLGMGEETALFRRIWEAETAPRFLYSPALRVYHWVPPEKMTMGYIVKRAAAVGQFEAVYTLQQQPGIGGRLRAILHTLRTLAGQVPRVLLKRRQYRAVQNWYFEHCFVPIQNVSKLLRLFGVRASFSQRKN